VTTILDVEAFYSLIAYARSIAVGLFGGAPRLDGAKGFVAPLHTAFKFRGHATIRCSGLLHHMHLLVPTQHSGVVLLILPHLTQGFVKPAGWLL